MITAMQLKAAVAAHQAGQDIEIDVGGCIGLKLRIRPSGVASWTLRYRLPGGHKRKTLGRYPQIGLAVARDMARKTLTEAKKPLFALGPNRLSEIPKRLWPRCTGIYFTSCGDYIKIGFASNIAARLRQLSTAAPTPLRLLAHMPGSIELEQRIHARFVDARVHREWFRPAFPLLAFIEELQQPQEE
jgi:hypothetical protein